MMAFHPAQSSRWKLVHESAKVVVVSWQCEWFKWLSVSHRLADLICHPLLSLALVDSGFFRLLTYLQNNAQRAHKGFLACTLSKELTCSSKCKTHARGRTQLSPFFRPSFIIDLIKAKGWLWSSSQHKGLIMFPSRKGGGLTWWDLKGLIIWK